MSLSNYKGYSLRKRFLWLTLLTVVANILFTGLLSHYTLREASKEMSQTEIQRTSGEVLAALDYAVSDAPMTTADIPKALHAKVMEIADINNHDVMIYDLSGRLLTSNRELNQIQQQRVPQTIVKDLLATERRLDIQEVDPESDSTKTSSYALLKNNNLENIGIVYLPYYYANDAYDRFMSEFLPQLGFWIIIVFLIILVSGYFISRSLSQTIAKFTDQISRITILGENPSPIRYYANDELGALVSAYNKMVRDVVDQKERLSFLQRNEAWRTMAAQVAHEVNTPLTPMKMLLQSFQKKFDLADPKLEERMNTTVDKVVGHIDDISRVARSFANFAKLRERQDVAFPLVAEVRNVLQVFSSDPIHIHTNPAEIPVVMDREFLQRIIENLVSNAVDALQDLPEDRLPFINVDIEKVAKRVIITVQDNGAGIPEDILQNIFEPNFSTKTNGMGLGLAIVKQIVTEYQGETTVKSEEGKGTTVTVSLPIAK